MENDKKLRCLYRTMQSIENRLGGGEGVEGLYGSINQRGMCTILDHMQRFCGLTKKSSFVDIGAGLGRPLLHAMLLPGVAAAHGIEVDGVKCAKADAFLKQTLASIKKKGVVDSLQPPTIECSPIEHVQHIVATHAYSFWEGVPFEARHAFGRLFKASLQCQSVAVVQRAIRKADPAVVLEREYGFGPLTLVGSFSVSMSGSGRSFTCYIFNKKSFMREQIDCGSSGEESVCTPELIADSPAKASCESSECICSRSPTRSRGTDSPILKGGVSKSRSEHYALRSAQRVKSSRRGDTVSARPPGAYVRRGLLTQS